MNYQETLTGMLEAAKGVAEAHWTAMSSFITAEIHNLAQGALWIEADFIADFASAKLPQNADNRVELEKMAKKRADLAYKSLKLAADGLAITAKADAKIATQDAINAALSVLRGAVNTSVGFKLL